MVERTGTPASLPGRKGFQSGVWAKRHLQSLIFALGQLARSPYNTLLTASVIGIALALPSSLFVMLDNVKTLTDRWQGAAQVSLYLKQGLPVAARERLITELELLDEVDQLTSISPEQALEEYRRLTGFEDLGVAPPADNPLPAVIVVYLAPRDVTTGDVEALMQRLAHRPEIDLIQSDLKWLERLRAIVELVHRGIGVVAGLFGFGVLLIVGNTIRIGIQSRHDEIEITKLIGATDAFIRRPFLYSGVWYGLLGALVAWLTVAGCVRLLTGPVTEIARLYGSEFHLAGPGSGLVLALLALGAGLGLLGSWLTVSRQLRLIEPD